MSVPQLIYPAGPFPPMPYPGLAPHRMEYPVPGPSHQAYHRHYHYESAPMPTPAPYYRPPPPLVLGNPNLNPADYASVKVEPPADDEPVNMHVDRPDSEEPQALHPDEICSSTSEEDEPEPPSTALVAVRRLVVEPKIVMSPDERSAIDKLAREHDITYKSVPFGERLIKEMLMSSVFSIPLSTDAALTAYRLTINRVTKVAQSFDPFLELHHTTQNKLLKQNGDLLVNLRGAVFFEERKQGIDQILNSMGVDDIAVGRRLIEAAMESVGQLGRVDYKNFNPLQKLDENRAAESRYDKLLSRVGSVVCMNLDFARILTYIVLFSSDFAELDSPARAEVEAGQMMLINMLKRYVFSEFSRPVAVNVFSALLRCIADLREISHIKKQRSLAKPVAESAAAQ